MATDGQMVHFLVKFSKKVKVLEMLAPEEEPHSVFLFFVKPQVAQKEQFLA